MLREWYVSRCRRAELGKHLLRRGDPFAGEARGHHRRYEQHHRLRRDWHGKLSRFNCGAGGGCDWECANWWADADYGSATVSGFYPPNLPLPATYYTTGIFVNPNGCDATNIPAFSSNSFHPGGVNVAFADGSVHFIKNSISSWNSMSITRIAPGPPNCALPAGLTQGVYQSLCTINGGEVLSSDSY